MLGAALAVGAATAVLQHQEEIKAIIENWDEIVEGVRANIREAIDRKNGKIPTGPVSGSGSGTLFENYSTSDSPDKSDTETEQTRATLRRRIVRDRARTSSEENSDFNGSLEMPSGPNYSESDVFRTCTSDSEACLSDFSIISREQHWGEESWSEGTSDF